MNLLRQIEAHEESLERLYIAEDLQRRLCTCRTGRESDHEDSCGYWFPQNAESTCQCGQTPCEPCAIREMIGRAIKHVYRKVAELEADWLAYMEDMRREIYLWN